MSQVWHQDLVAVPEKNIYRKKFSLSAEPTIVYLDVKLKSALTTRSSPVRIVDNVIRVDEYQMEEGEPYAFRYQDQHYMLTRTDGKLTLYELR